MAQQVAEAVRIGPANMPRLGQPDRRPRSADIVSYVTGRLQHPTNPGGAGLGGVGPGGRGLRRPADRRRRPRHHRFWIGERS